MSHILVSLDFTARFQMLLKLPKKKNVCYSITDDNIVQPEFLTSNQCWELKQSYFTKLGSLGRTLLKYGWMTCYRTQALQGSVCQFGNVMVLQVGSLFTKAVACDLNILSSGKG